MKHIARVCAGLIVIAYFLPWMTMIGSISGFTMGKGAIMSIGKSAAPGWVYASVLLVILGVATAIINKKREHIVSGVVGVITVVWILIAFSSAPGEVFFEIVGIGIWLTLVAAIGQIVGAFMLEESPANDSVESEETVEE